MPNKLVREALREYVVETHPPVYFVDLTVENFRCFGPRQTLRLADDNGIPYQWTVLVGENGVGKTTLLQLLALMIPVARRAINTDQIVPAPLLYSKILDGDWAFNPRDASAKTDAHCSVRVGSRLNRIATGEAEANFGVEYNTDSSGSPVRLGATGLSEQSLGKDVFGLICYGYGPYRQMAIPALNVLPDQHGIDSLFSNDKPLTDPENWLLQVDYSDKRHGLSGEKSSFGRVVRLLTRLLPDIASVSVSDSATRSNASIIAETAFGRRNLRELSLGYQSTIALVIDMASRLYEQYPYSDNPLLEPAIVLIDEVDLHLHPKWQRQFFDTVGKAFENTQFVVTTHSPLVVQSTPDANLVLLRQEGDHVVIDGEAKSMRNWRVDQILTSDLFDLPTARPPQLDKAIAERNKILSKSTLSAKDRQQLKQLDTEIGPLPGGQTLADAQAMDIIREAADLIRATQGTSK